MPREYPEHPIIGVGAVVWRDDRVLLIRRGRPPLLDEWSLPGGRQEIGETVAEAARREVYEETGIDIEVRDVVAVVDLIDRDADGRVRFHYTLIDLLAEWRAGEPVAADDAAAVVWATLDKLAQYTVWSETERVIRLAAERRKAYDHAD
ncbi:MAG TPA: NUDIX hydrolase [Herpetosiphonaceae bacterium]